MSRLTEESRLKLEKELERLHGCALRELDKALYQQGSHEDLKAAQRWLKGVNSIRKKLGRDQIKLSILVKDLDAKKEAKDGA